MTDLPMAEAIYESTEPVRIGGDRHDVVRCVFDKDNVRIEVTFRHNSTGAQVCYRFAGVKAGASSVLIVNGLLYVIHAHHRGWETPRPLAVCDDAECHGESTLFYASTVEVLPLPAHSRE